MSTDKDMYAEREEVLILHNKNVSPIHYDSLQTGDIYCVKLLSGSFSVYKKTNYFDDQLIVKLKSREEVMKTLESLSIKRT